MNCVIACTALGFQVTVLYPWHKELDDNFEKLKKEHLMVLDMIRNTADAAAVREGKLGQHPPKQGGGKGLREWLGLGTRSLE